MPAVVPPSARLRAAFAAVDVDRSGEVDTKELCSLFSKLGVERTPAQCEELLSKAVKSMGANRRARTRHHSSDRRAGCETQ